MPKKKELDLDLLIRLREKGVSLPGIADRFEVSVSTVKRLLRGWEPDPQVLTFAGKLQKLAMEAPDDYCKKEINRAVNFLRTQQAASKTAKYQKIVCSIHSGAREIDEISEDCRFSKHETSVLLDELIEQGKIEARDRGGILNRGRKMKLHYHIKRVAQPSSSFNFSFPPGNRPVPASL